MKDILIEIIRLYIIFVFADITAQFVSKIMWSKFLKNSDKEKQNENNSSN